MRRSEFIGRRQATNFSPAIRLAAKLGCPLNQSVTLNFAHTALPDEEVSKAFEKLRKNYFTKWLGRPGKGYQGPVKPAAYIWVIENPSQCHVHWLVHVPDDRLKAFLARLPKWLRKVTGGVHCEASAIHVRPASTPFGARGYMLKGIDPAYAAFYGIEPEPQGIVFGKRCGFSRSLGPMACRKARTYYTQMREDGYRPTWPKRTPTTAGRRDNRPYGNPRRVSAKIPDRSRPAPAPARPPTL